MKRYVDAERGNDNNSGEIKNPWKTIQHSVNEVNAGDIVYVLKGIYNERIVFNKSGTVGKPIKLVNYPEHSPIIDGSGITWSDGIWGGLLDANHQSNLKIEGIHIQNSYGMGIGAKWIGSKTEGSSNISIKNCSITIAGGSGIHFMFADNILIDGCSAKKVCKNLGQEGISLTGTSDFKIRNCLVVDCYKEGIDVKEGCQNGSIQDCFVSNAVRGGIYIDAYSKNQSNIEVFNNTITNMRNGVGISTGAEAGGELSNILIHNNTVYDCLRGYNIASNNKGSGLPYQTKNVILRRNTAFNVKLTGVFITADVKNLTIEDNILFPDESVAGIRIHDLNYTDLSEITIRNNFFKGLNLTRADLPVGEGYTIV